MNCVTFQTRAGGRLGVWANRQRFAAKDSQLEGAAASGQGVGMMVELKLDLCDSLAQEAKSKGLLEPPAVERMLRAELMRNRVDELFAAADRLAGQNLPSLSEAEMDAEIQAARSQRRAADASRR